MFSYYYSDYSPMSSSLQERRTMAYNDPQPNLLLTIRGLLPSLNEQEQKVGQYVLDHPYEVIHLAMVELAERCGVGDTTIFRFCRRVRTDAYQDFKIALAQELTPVTPPVYEAVAAGDSAATAAPRWRRHYTRSTSASLRRANRIGSPMSSVNGT
jgi:DNA-binding MurR/RpiR family transcriptional regulator